ncbi:MAG: STAS domain-containing protein [Deltaproteobacteria bacterium]|nr:STAS domain-containing protein [Deltaproteobacteria bacterium]
MKDLKRKLASLFSFLLELIVYSGFVAAYFLIVIHFLGGWIKHIYLGNKTHYALVAVGLIAAQGVLLERLTAILLWLVECLKNIIPVLYRMTRPYESIARPEDAPDLLVYRFAGPLYYFNAAYFASRVQEMIDSSDEPVKVFLLNAEAIVDMDMNGVEVLEQVYYDLKVQGIVLALCEAKGDFRKVLQSSRLRQRAGFKIYRSVAEAEQELIKKSPKKTETR